MNVTYERQLVLLHQICHDVGFWEDITLFNKLIEYGWIKPKDEGERPGINGSHSAHWYVLTAKGHLVLSPRENRVEGLPVPFFPSSGCLTRDGQQVCILAAYLEEEAQA